MPVDSRISFDEVEAGVVVISLKLVVDGFFDGKKVLASRLEAIVLDEASVGNVVRLEPLVVDIFIVVLVVVLAAPRLLANGAPNSVFASASDNVDEPPSSTVDDGIVEVAVNDDVEEEEEEEEEDKSVVIESPALIVTIARGGSGFDIMASTPLFLLPPPLPIFATLLIVVVGPMLFSSMPPLGAITELLDSSSLRYDGAFARRYFIFPLLIRSACNCGGRAMHPTANGTNHMAARIVEFMSLRRFEIFFLQLFSRIFWKRNEYVYIRFLFIRCYFLFFFNSFFFSSSFHGLPGIPSSRLSKRKEW